MQQNMPYTGFTWVDKSEIEKANKDLENTAELMQMLDNNG